MKMRMTPGAKGVMWAMLGLYLLSAVLYGAYMAFLLHAQSEYDANPKKDSFGPLWCGNTITDPLTLILNWGSPVALLACIALSISSRVRTRSPGSIMPALAFILPTACLLGFAIWVFHGPWLAGTCRVADVVWWMFGL